SFVGAAEALGLSRAAVSRLVGELESRLGVRLLHRTTRRLSLTDEGRIFHLRCKAVLAELDEAEAEVSARSGAARGLLKLDGAEPAGLLLLAPVGSECTAWHPAGVVDITLSDRVVDLVEEGYDMAVRIGRLASSSLIGRQVASTRMVLCASPGYLAA